MRNGGAVAICALALALIGTLHSTHRVAGQTPEWEFSEPGVPGEAGQAPLPFTLEEISQIALAESPRLREARAEARAARGRAYQAGLYPNPTVYTGSPQWSANVSQYNALVGQDVVTAGKLSLDAAAAAREARRADLQYLAARFELLTEVRQAFIATVAAQRRVVALERLLALAEDSHDVAQRLVEGGEWTRTEMLLLVIEREKAAVALENQRALAAGHARKLAAVAGVPELEIDRVEFDLDAATPDYEYEMLRQGVLSRHALAAVARVEVSRRRLLLERALAEPIPNLNLQAGYQYDVQGPHHAQAVAQLSFTLPLWDRSQGRIRAARGDVASASAHVERVENELAALAAESLGEYLAADQLVEAYRDRIVPAAEEALAQIDELRERGEFDFMRGLQAQRAVAESELALVGAQEARWQAAAELAGLLQLEEFP